jgi:hypothetical protein
LQLTDDYDRRKTTPGKKMVKYHWLFIWYHDLPFVNTGSYHLIFLKTWCLIICYISLILIETAEICFVTYVLCIQAFNKLKI